MHTAPFDKLLCMFNKHHLARTFRRFPLFAKLFTIVFRMTQPRNTAGVTGVLLDDEGRVLLVEHVFHAELPWGLPGGWLGRNEEPAIAIAREFREETGLDVEVVRPLMVVQGRRWNTHLDIAYLLQMTGPLQPLELSFELIGFGWFALDELPPVSRFNREVLATLESGISV